MDLARKYKENRFKQKYGIGVQLFLDLDKEHDVLKGLGKNRQGATDPTKPNRNEEMNNRKVEQTLPPINNLKFGIPVQESSNLSMEGRKSVEISYFNPYTSKPFPSNYFDLLYCRRRLRIWDYKETFMDLLRKNQAIILAGDTGCGKTTQVPQWCLEYSRSVGNKLVACTQPRRLNATSVAHRVAEEIGVELGRTVGYCIPFDNFFSRETLLKYVTDDMLFREVMSDPELNDYQVILLDEVHERTLAMDMLMAILKGVLVQRKDFKLVIMSATLNTRKFKEYFDNAPLLEVPGRLHPVELHYEPATKTDYLQAAVRKVFEIHTGNEIEGDLLVFLTGQEEIEKACIMIEEEIKNFGPTMGTLKCIPLYSSLPLDLQEKTFEPAPPKKENGAIGRKVIVSTNMAETSLTIDGVVFVIDCGYSKMKVYNPRERLTSLFVTPISKTTAKQRAGRAGRTRPGKCFRLYSENAFNNMKPEEIPEMLKSNLGRVFLNLMKLGIKDLIHFDYVDPPSPETLMAALEVLHHLEAIDYKADLTALGSLMADFGLDPELSKTLVSSYKYGCSNEILSIVSMLSVPQCFVRPLKLQGAADFAKLQFVHESGDHATLLNVYEAFKKNNESKEWCSRNFLNYQSLKECDEVRKQLSEILNRSSLPRTFSEFSPGGILNNINKALVSGFFMQLATRKKSEKYFTVKDNQTAVFHSSASFSTLDRNPECVLYHSFVNSSENDCRPTSYIKTVTELETTEILHWGYQLKGLSQKRGVNNSMLDELRDKLNQAR